MKVLGKKLLVFLTIMTLISVLFTGCSSNKTTNANANTPKEKTKVTVMSWWNLGTSKPLQELKSKFESENPGYELEFQQIASKYADKLITVIAGGGDQVPDVAMLAMDVVPRYAKANAIQPLDKYMTNDYKKSLYPVALEAVKYNGKIYAAPRDITSFVMYCNKKLFTEANIPIPTDGWTWDDFLNDAKKLTKVEGGKPVQWGYYFPKTNDSIFTWLIQNGGDYTTSDGKKSILSNKESVEALQFLQDLIYKYKVCPTDTEAKQFGADDDSASFYAGKVAMKIGGLSNSVGIEKAGVDYVKVPLPKGKKQASTAFVNTWAIPKGAKHPDAAWKVIKFLSSKEGQQIVLQTKMGLPASKDVNTDDFIKERADNKCLIDSLKYSVPFRTLSNGAEYYDLVNKELSKSWANQESVTDAAKAIDSQSKDILSK